MCRYAFSGPCKQKWACFGCRKMFRQNRGEANIDELKCPECKLPMRLMGLDFKAPRQSDLKQWKKVELLFASGFSYASCGCGAGARPRYLREVPEFLHGQERARADWQSAISKQTSRERLKQKARDAAKARAWKQAEARAKRETGEQKRAAFAAAQVLVKDSER